MIRFFWGVGEEAIMTWVVCHINRPGHGIQGVCSAYNNQRENIAEICGLIAGTFNGA